MSKEFYGKLSSIVKELKAPKGQYNSFGNYKYRNCEDILEAVKPLLDGLFLSISDEIVVIGDRYYVKATATITDGESSHSASALARESLSKKGMDDAQVTGATSSYARKYCLNGLFGIDDSKDPDSDEHRNNADNRSKQQNQNQNNGNRNSQPPKLNETEISELCDKMGMAASMGELKQLFAKAFKMTTGHALQKNVQQIYAESKAKLESS
ncbi:essential recombination function protein [Pantoea phage PdC23]|uniref:Essential recombination function protein n=1 Tax=Pantoea phage PdC23 TaxID=2894356 RepID=A0AAE8YHK6_9CAUD|nr:essential recombination function protein [Pantoea phage PdC23]UGC97756.1 essential recombination function protein [Pantoea phage PdC23]